MAKLINKMLHHIKHCFTEYSTTREVKIPSRFLAITHFVLVIIVWCSYIGSLRLDLRKIYQKECSVQGSMITKVKGAISTENIPISEFQVSNPDIYRRIWDISDLIFPPYGGDGSEGSFIVATNILITPNQTKGICPEAESIGPCKKDSDCKKGEISHASSGVLNGKCQISTGTCEVSAWCPTEQNIVPLKGNKVLLEQVKDFTVMVKNTVAFPDCGSTLQQRNILPTATKEYLSKCIHNIESDTTCPIFRLGDVVEWSGHNFSDVALTGAVFRIEANWDCDLDWRGSGKTCFPKFKFSRIDEADANISPGWNFRSALYYEEDRRTLMKIYGLKFLVETTGEGRQFDFFTLVVTTGATIGLFVLAPLVCDFLFELLCVLKRFYPFSKCFQDFSVKSRFQNSEDCLPSTTASIKQQQPNINTFESN